MSNLIITVIAISCTAALTLAGIYYGGSSYGNNQMAAKAATAINGGQQLAGAWSTWLLDHKNVAPTDLSLLTPAGGGTYLTQIPQWSPAPGGVTMGYFSVAYYNSHYYALADVGAPTTPGTWSASDHNSMVCVRIIQTALNKGMGAAVNTAVTPDTIISSANNTGNDVYGCAPFSTNSGSVTQFGTTGTFPPAGDYVLAYLLS